MADDFVSNVRQLGQYPNTSSAAYGDLMLIQKGGLGGPYNSILGSDLVSTALMMGAWLRLAPDFGIAWNGAGLTYANGTFAFSEQVFAPVFNTEQLNSAGDIFVAGEAVATQTWAQSLFDAIATTYVSSFNGRGGAIMLMPEDILRAGGILQNNPVFSGVVIVPTLWDARANNDQAASTAWVQSAICASISDMLSVQGVTSFNGRYGQVTLNADDVTAALTVPGAYASANTAPMYTANSWLATTLFVDNAIEDLRVWTQNEVEQGLTPDLSPYALLNSPAFTGTPTAPTAAPGSVTGQIATTAFVMNAVTAATAGVSSFNTRTGAVTLITADVTSAGGAPIASPTFTGTPHAPTATTGTNTTQIATTQFVMAEIAAAAPVTSFNTRTGAITLTTADITGAGGAPNTSPALGGVPTAPTAPPNTNTTQLATCAFVEAALSGVVSGVSSFNSRTGAVTLQSNDISAAQGALLASPNFTGNPTAPTQALGTNNTTLATTAFVLANSAAGGVSSFNGRTGAITLITGDITGAGGAPLTSPNFVGVPTAPTPAQSSNDTTVATTAYVRAALSAATGVASFNGRTGVVTLTTADITGAGGAPLASPALTGTPSGPTANPGTNTGQLATTAFVFAAVGASVSSFNTRTGAVVLIGNDISNAGGAMLASPAFTGTPTAPTPGVGTNNTQIATTAFVLAQITASGVLSYKQSDTAPTGGQTLWFDSLNGQLYVSYIDPSTSAQSWVIANSVPSPPPQPGARVLLGETVVSSSTAAVSWFTGFDGTYEEFELRVYDVLVSVVAGLVLQVSADGSTFDTAASSYGWMVSQAANAAASGNVTFNYGAGSGINFTSAAKSLAIFYMSARLKRTTVAPFCMTYEQISNNDVNLYQVTGGGWYNGISAIKGVRLISSSGTIMAGTFKLYGIVK